MSSITNLHQLFQSNERDRIAKEQKAIDRIIDPALPRHTVYKGDRTIQQLGDQPIENGVILNNQSLAIGDVMLPLAKGNVLRRVNSTNGGALLGTAYRDAVEKDFDANGKRRSTVLSRNGGNEPSDPASITYISYSANSGRVPPPFGCTPPPSKCFWSSNPIAPNGFQNHGDAVVSENALPVYLHCVAGTSVPANLNCGFLDPKNWSCSGGVCSPNPSGIYTSQAQCEAALIPAGFTGGQCKVLYNVEVRLSVNSAASVGYLTSGYMGGIIGFRKVDIGNNQKTVIIIYNSGETEAAFDTEPQGWNLFINSVTRVDGLPDNCGNPTPTCPI